MKSILGFLENLDYDDKADSIGNSHGVGSRVVRRWMNNNIESTFNSIKAPYTGPVLMPPGGYFFKLDVKDEPKVLKKFVLRKLNIGKDMKMSFGVKDSNMQLSFLVKKYPNYENPGKLDIIREDNAFELKTFVRAFLQMRENSTEPYFIEADENFRRKYMV